MCLPGATGLYLAAGHISLLSENQWAPWKHQRFGLIKGLVTLAFTKDSGIDDVERQKTGADGIKAWFLSQRLFWFLIPLDESGKDPTLGNKSSMEYSTV